MSAARWELQEALCCYIADTATYVDKVKEVCHYISKWMVSRMKELHMMKDIKERADLTMEHVAKAEKKGQALKEYIKSKVTAESKFAELEKELKEVLKDTLEGLEKLNNFLDAVEKLAVTSLHVFMENQVFHLPKEIRLKDFRVVIAAAQFICPLLLEFKRDAKSFFCPKLQNVEVLIYQLEKYIQTTQKICDGFEKSCISELSLNMTVETVVELDVSLSEDDIQRMLHHIHQLKKIRMNQAFRLVFLFKDEQSSDFIKKFSECQPRMLQFLQELEGCAVQLDRMNKGSKISSVAGSSVGAVGGILSIVGLALIPFTAGVSLALTMTGLGLGITSGVNSLVTTATEIGVNCTQNKKANEVFKIFMEDVKALQDCLDEVMNIETGVRNIGALIPAMVVTVGAIGKSIDSMVDSASAAKMLKSKDLMTNAGKVLAQESKAFSSTSRVASDVPDIGQAVVKGPLALTKSARAGLMVANALFLGLDIFFICKDSISLAKGTEAQMSRLIRARAELWGSEINSWQKSHDLLSEGHPKSEKHKVILETLFYPEMEERKQKDT